MKFDIIDVTTITKKNYKIMNIYNNNIHNEGQNVSGTSNSSSVYLEIRT